MKGYDTLNQEFIIVVLDTISLSPRFIGWIKSCIIALSFLVGINGELIGFFKSSQNLRQRNLISPYLFIIAIEVLSCMLKELKNSTMFSHHWKFKKNNIAHLCFANDLKLFCRVDISSISFLRDTLKQVQSQLSLRQTF